MNPVVPDLDNASVGNKEKHPRKPALLCSLLLIVANISLAVIAINELIRITKKGGQILILVWALEQEPTSRRKFIQQENFVDFKDKKQNLLGKRYYYVFKKNELESLIPEGVEIIRSFYEKGNWGIIIKK